MTTKEVLKLENDKGKSLLLCKLFLETSQLHAWPHGSFCLLHVLNLVLALVKFINCNKFLLGKKW